jgi:hypothetical protein
MQKKKRIGCDTFSLLSILLLAIPFNLFSFSYTFREESPKDSVADSTRNSLTVELDYISNSSFYGRNGGVKYPFLMFSTDFQTKKNVWVSSSFSHLIDTGKFINEINLSAGWDFELNDRIDGSISYAHYFFSSSSPLVKTSANNSIVGSIGYDWGFVYTTLSPNFVFGHSNDIFIAFGNSRYFEKVSIFGKEDFISFEPKFSIIAGTQNFDRHYVVRKENSNGKGNPNPHIVQAGGDSSFKIIDYELSLPLTYSTGNLSFESRYIFSLPVNVIEGDPSKTNSAYSFAVYYTFN